MNHEELIREKAAQLGVLRPRDVGVPRTVWSDLVKAGVLERTAWGLYRVLEHEPSEHHSLVEVAAKVSHGIISHSSALSFHGIGTQAPRQVWVTIEGRARKPLGDYPPLCIVRASGVAFTEGVEYYRIEGRDVPIYSVEKTIADCFKYRTRVGLDVALEALKDAWLKKRLDANSLFDHARICRVDAVIRPYFEAIQA